MDPEPAGWDIVSGVGLTALGAAAMRALEGHHAEPLVRDPYAAAFVSAAAGQLPAPIAVTPDEAAADPGFPWFGLAHYMAVRSRFFDDFLSLATRAGLRQTVILAAGLDTRAFRLDWMPGATVYEIDVPMVLGFKDSVLAGQGAAVRCDRRTVTADLRANWPAEVREAGFDPAAPTAWLAEGLFPYLTDEALDVLLGRVHELSAPGSRIVAEHVPSGTSAIGGSVKREIASRAGEELTTIWVAGQQHDPASWLLGHGWTTGVSRVSWVAEAYGRPMTDLQPENLRVMQLITGELAPITERRG
ncbi:MAG: SAM-dependent methyltransferase [Trebonia sp.]